LQLLHKLGKRNAIVSGDTRFDRVASILKQDNTVSFIDTFKNGTTTVVAGSTWPKDEEIVLNFINSNTTDTKFIIAPHNIKPDQILQLKKSCTKKVVLYSEKEGKDLKDFDVFIIDTIGILTKIYCYADIAYVGGGFGNPGVHNILEPATFGIPIIVGPNYFHFAEASDLVNLGGCLSIKNEKELTSTFIELIEEKSLQIEKGAICSYFVQKNTGAVTKIIDHLSRNIV
jgi:3-deoxy-D-manno-octulosonic-acid transferase